MGIDATVWARVDVTQQDLDTAQEHSGLDLRLTTEGGVVVVEWWTLDRYYGPDYARGHWPRIRQGIDALALTFPGAPIYYGGDGEFMELVTPDLLTELDEMWEREGNTSYDARRRSLTARLEGEA